MPKTRLDFWRPKLEGNRARDLRQEAELAAKGWTLHIVWECRIGDEALLTELAEKIRATPAVGSCLIRAGPPESP